MQRALRLTTLPPPSLHNLQLFRKGTSWVRKPMLSSTPTPSPQKPSIDDESSNDALSTKLTAISLTPTILDYIPAKIHLGPKKGYVFKTDDLGTGYYLEDHELALALASLHSLKEAEDRPNLFIDVGYGWPKEKKPRKERINAVARQVVNFLEARGENLYCAITIIGAEPDLSPLKTRFLEINTSPSSTITFLPSQIENHAPSAIYLSPDTSQVLDVTSVPPRDMVIGGIVDRNVAVGRSMKYAEGKGMAVRVLPLSGIGLEGLGDDEALNIDNILEMVDSWHHLSNSNSSSSLTQEEVFVKAATDAMFAHQERHPANTLHDNMIKDSSGGKVKSHTKVKGGKKEEK